MAANGRLQHCGLTKISCSSLASALKSNPSYLRNLDLSENKLKDSGVELLCDSLRSPKCKLEILWLDDCGLTKIGCSSLASALESNPSHLRHVELSFNLLGDSDMKPLRDLKKNPNYRLESLIRRYPVFED